MRDTRPKVAPLPWPGPALAAALLALLAAGCFGTCGAPPLARTECRSSSDCARVGLQGLVCTQGVCRPCADDAACGSGRRCRESQCVSWSHALPPDCPDVLTVELRSWTGPLEPAAQAVIDRAAGCLRAGAGSPGSVSILTHSESRGMAVRQALERAGVNPSLLHLEFLSVAADDPSKPLVGILLRRASEAAPDTVTFVRYPAVEAPKLMRPGQASKVTVALATKASPGVLVQRPDGSPSTSGEVSIPVPRTPDLPAEQAWKIRVDLSMPDAEISPPVGEVLLRNGQADVPAVFQVKPTWTPATPAERRESPLLATFSREGTVFARAIRMVSVTADPAVVEPPGEAQGWVQAGEVPDRPDAGDLNLEVITHPRGTDATAPDRAFVSAKLAADPGPESDANVTWVGLDAFLQSRFDQLAGLARRGQGEVSSEADPDAARRATAAMVRQLGQDLWTRYTPPLVQAKLRALQRAHPSGADVRIQSNDPRLPYELLLVPVDGAGDCARGATCELLGVLHRVSRWYAGSGPGTNPTARRRAGRFAVLAPAYVPPLVNAERERDALLALGPWVYTLDGKLGPMLELLGHSPSPAVLHYAGHGEALPGTRPGLERYALRLQDRPLELDMFRSFAAWRTADGEIGPLVFLNACDVGRAGGAYGFVEGWGPAALERGAAGFVGGLWPLGDTGAQGFARRFYARVLAGDPVAEAVRKARAGYATEADPTYAAYVFYGHPELRVSGPP